MIWSPFSWLRGLRTILPGLVANWGNESEEVPPLDFREECSLVILRVVIPPHPQTQVKWTSASLFGIVSRQPRTAPSAIILIFHRECRELYGPYRGLEAVTILALTASASAPPTLSAPAVSPTQYPPRDTAVTSIGGSFMRACYAPSAAGLSWFLHGGNDNAGNKNTRQPLAPIGVGVPRPNGLLRTPPQSRSQRLAVPLPLHFDPVLPTSAPCAAASPPAHGCFTCVAGHIHKWGNESYEVTPFGFFIFFQRDLDIKSCALSSPLGSQNLNRYRATAWHQFSNLMHTAFEQKRLFPILWFDKEALFLCRDLPISSVNRTYI